MNPLQGIMKGLGMILRSSTNCFTAAFSKTLSLAPHTSCISGEYRGGEDEFFFGTFLRSLSPLIAGGGDDNDIESLLQGFMAMGTTDHDTLVEQFRY